MIEMYGDKSRDGLCYVGCFPSNGGLIVTATPADIIFSH